MNLWLLEVKNGILFFVSLLVATFENAVVLLLLLLSINYNENRDPNENNFKLDLNKNKDDTIKVSDYILVAFPSEKKSFKNYVCVVQDVLSQDEAEVVGMICCNKEKTMFKLNEKDVSVINFSQVIKKMEFPKMLLAGDRLKYEFSEPLDVEEPNTS